MCIITLIQVENVFMFVSSLIFACPIKKFFPKLDVYLRILNIVPKPASAIKLPTTHLWNHAGYYLFVGPKAAKDHKYSCVCLHSDRNPQERRTNLDKFKVFLYVACFSTIQFSCYWIFQLLQSRYHNTKSFHLFQCYWK